MSFQVVRHYAAPLAILLLIATAPLRAAEKPVDRPARAEVRPEIAIASHDAVNSLLDEVSRAYITRQITVGDFLHQTNSTDELLKTLARAEQIGGPRWVDGRVCQIELQISGPRVSVALQRIAAANKKSPLSSTELAHSLKSWDERAFTGNGSALALSPIPQTPDANQKVAARNRPGLGLRRDPWAEVPQAARDQALSAAKLDAARRSLNSVAPVPLTANATVGDVLAVKDVGDGMENWFISQPVDQLDWRDDLQVEISLKATPDDTLTTLRELARKQKTVPLPDERGWASVKTDFLQKMLMPVGRGVVPADDALVGFAPRKTFSLSTRKPAWTHQRVTTTATGEPAKSKLQAARAAEAAAERKILSEIENLKLDDQTIGKLGESDKRVASAVSRAITHARIGKAEYLDDGRAKVEVYLDLEDLWQELKTAE